MTKELYQTLSRVFKADETPTERVGITADERVYILAEIYESYRPRMPAGARNSGYIGTGVFELIDKGDYCGLRQVFLSRAIFPARITFSDMAHAEKWRVAHNEARLKEIMATITVDTEESVC